MTAEEIAALCRQGKVQWTDHVQRRIMQRGILRQDVKDAIFTGIIIEEYPNDYPYPSCLLLGENRLHVVCGIGERNFMDYYGIPSDKRQKGIGFENAKGESGMTCFMCKGEMEEKPTTFMVDLGNCIVIVKNVPSHVCRQCGEVSYSDEVSGRLEKIVETMKKSPVEISVSTYAA